MRRRRQQGRAYRSRGKMAWPITYPRVTPRARWTREWGQPWRVGEEQQGRAYRSRGRWRGRGRRSPESRGNRGSIPMGDTLMSASGDFNERHEDDSVLKVSGKAASWNQESKSPTAALRCGRANDQGFPGQYKNKRPASVADPTPSSRRQH
jgi:hypothetical protein